MQRGSCPHADRALSDPRCYTVHTTPAGRFVRVPGVFCMPADVSQPRKLTLKQQRFIAAYLGEARGNATEAARIAGYAHPMQAGHRLLRNDEIAARVKQHVEESFASADLVLAELTDVALAEWRDFVEVLAYDKQGNPVRVRMDLSNKVKALELLGKHHQLFTEKQEINVNVREHRRAVPQSTIDRILQPADPRMDA